MANLLFVGTIALSLSLIFSWSFRFLSRERWQIFGTLPLFKLADGSWHGLNLTYYGVINAFGVTAASAMAIVLLLSIHLPIGIALSTIGSILIFCVPLAKVIARWVEKKPHTFSVGGAAFVGLVVTPPLLWGIGRIPGLIGPIELPVMPILAALAIGYALGEGIGRLACISFGCCYGKPLDSFPERWRKHFEPFSIIYYGETKKAAYAGGLNGRKTLAVPAITAALYSGVALFGCYLFLSGRADAAYLACVLITQIWRFISEFLRADYRGAGNISVYQKMAMLSCVAAVFYFATLPVSDAPYLADILHGLTAGWDPLILLLFQAVWLATFLYLGRSQVTAAQINLFVRRDRI